MALELFKSANRTWAPSTVMWGGLPVGFLDETGVVDNTTYSKQKALVDNFRVSAGGYVPDIEGTLDMMLVEPTITNMIRACGLQAATAISTPATGYEVSASPKRLLDGVFMEFWGLGPNRKTIYKCMQAEIENKPAITLASREQMKLALSMAPIFMSASHPEGAIRFYDAVAEATATAISSSTPADSGTDVDPDATITLNFNRPLTGLALDETIYSLVPSGGSALTISVAFGTFSRYGKTCTNPYQLVITPASSMATSTAHTLTVPAAMPTVDGVPMAADDTVAFTTAAS